MKYTYISALSLLFLLSPFAITQAEEMAVCIQMIQPAVNAEGVCEEFSTPCAVPDGWKTVPSCELIQPENFGDKLENVNTRREQSKWETLREKLKTKRENSKQRVKNVRLQSRFGKANLVKDSQEYQSRQKRIPIKTSALKNRNYTQPEYQNKTAVERFKNLNPQIGGLKRSETKAERYEENFIEKGRQRPAIEGSTQMKRTGYLSTVKNQVGVKKTTEANWNNRKKVARFWTRLKPETKPSKLRTEEEIQDRLKNRRFRRSTIERDFGFNRDISTETETETTTETE